MGSKSDPIPFDQLTIVVPTEAERSKTWAATHPQWGAALDMEAYLRREAYLTTVPMSRNGGITHWILTTVDGEPDARPVLSSCESIRKRCLIAGPGTDGAVRECSAHGIASVFTEPPYRGNGYASKMMALLGPKLGSWQGRRLASSKTDAKDASPPPSGRAIPGGGTGCEETEVACSVLFSDIGKTFYAKNGWPPYESCHLSFAPEAGGAARAAARPVGYHELAELCSLDEKLLKARLSRPDPANPKTRVALVPDLDAILWHLMREDYMTTHIFGRTPTVRGGIFGDVGRRVWAVWTRGYYGGLKRPDEGNTLHVLRLAFEDEEACDEAYLTEAVGALLALARHEAAEWKVNHVEMWNPSDKVRRLVDGTGVPHEFVDREKDSIASLMWYGDGEVEWVANEKFGWC